MIVAQEDAQKAYDQKAEIKSTYTKTVCDPVSGIITMVYEQADDCKGEEAKKVITGWGSCIKDPESGNYFKFTGANALKAASIAIVAFVGFQF